MIRKAFSSEYFKELKNLRKRKLIFFNGCFDIMHVGHLYLINKVKGLAEYKFGAKNYQIICGLNSDESVKKQNKEHPLINNQNNRALFLEHLDIDHIFIFDEPEPTALIMSLVPDVVVKGSDYRGRDYPEKEFLEKADIDVQYITLLEDYSTTNIYNKIAKQVKQQVRESI